MSFVAVAIGGSSLVTGALGYAGAQSAANTQANSANNALAFQKQVYADNQPRFAAANTAFGNAQNNATSAFNTSSAAFQPWVTSGQNANYTLSSLMGGAGGSGGNTQPDYSSFFNSPDYNFAQQQGQRGVINAANAQGVGLSGGTLKDLSTFNSGLASQQYGNYFNRLMGLSQAGQNAASGLSTAATNYGNTSANIAGGIGNLATGAANSNNAMASNIGNTTQAVGQAQASGIVGGTNAITGAVNSSVSNSLLANYLGKSPSAYGSGPAYGGGGAWGGSSANPLAGLNASDYGAGF